MSVVSESVPIVESSVATATARPIGPRTLITFALGAPKYLRMAVALMESARAVAGDSLEYILFSDLRHRSSSPYQIPHWLRLEKLQGDYQLGGKDENLGLKRFLFRQPVLRDRPVLFLDSDTWVYFNRFDALFGALEQRSVLVCGEYLEPGETWQTIDFQRTAAKAGYEIRNMSLNSGLLGRYPDATGHAFADLFYELLKERRLVPFMPTPFLKQNDEPYVVIALQMAYRQTGRALPEPATPITTADYISTYEGFLTDTGAPSPTVHKPKKGIVQRQPAMIHFFGGVDFHYYFKLQQRAVRRTWRGWALWPAEWLTHLRGRLRAKLDDARRRRRKRRL